MTRFVWSLREGCFPLYVQLCDELCSSFHALDHTIYARWLPVHVRDMVQLAKQNPEVHAEFMKGNFVVQKFRRKFSLMAKTKPMSNQIRSSRRKAEQLDFTREPRGAYAVHASRACLCADGRRVRGHPRPTAIFSRSSRGGEQLASDVPKGYIIFPEAWQPFRCNKSGAGSTRYSECHERVRCGITV